MQVIGRRQVVLGLATIPLSACAAVDMGTLTAVGGRVDNAHVDFRLLHNLARRADDSQRAEDVIRQKWPKTTEVGRVASVDVRYVLERDDTTRSQYIAMPGSLSLKDWLEDFDLSLKPESRYGIPLHRGFEDSARATYDALRARLEPNYKTYISGYSMGAGVAAVMSMYMVADGYNLVRTATFGQPRVTNSIGARAFAKLPITRVVNVDDFVSMVPTFPFEHFGEEVVLHPGKDYVYLTHEDANRISIGEIWRERHGLSIGPHASELYVARLAEKLEGARPVPYLTRLT